MIRKDFKSRPRQREQERKENDEERNEVANNTEAKSCNKPRSKDLLGNDNVTGNWLHLCRWIYSLIPFVACFRYCRSKTKPVCCPEMRSAAEKGYF